MNFDAQKISDFLASHNLSMGIGTIEEPCSIAAINLALTGRLTDDIPECMSEVIGQWIIRIQDAMPNSMRNHSGWKALLPLAAGTGRDPALELRRAELLLNWMWSAVLPQLQEIADANGFGAPWHEMLTERTVEASEAASVAAAWWASAGRTASEAASDAAAWASRAARAAADAAEAVEAVEAASAASEAAAAAAWASWQENDEFWTRVDPVKMLKNLAGLT